MNHFSFDIISKLAHADFLQPDLTLQQSFNDHVLSMPIFILGEQIDMPCEQTATEFLLDKASATKLLSLPLYLHEADAVMACGEGEYFAAGFDLAILFAETNRVDARLVDGIESLHISHETLLQLRDIGATEHTAVPIPDEEIAAQREAMLTFAVRARAYCARHTDVDMLYLGTLTRPGVTPMLVGALSAQQYARHAQALTQLSIKVFQPRWRFMLFGDACGPANIVKDLRQTPPCYRKVIGQSWFAKLKNKIEAPTLSLIGL